MDVQTDPEAGVRDYSRARIFVLMAIAVAAAAFAGLIFGNARFFVGVLVGGALSYANFAWLESSAKGLFADKAEGRSSGLPAARFILRYLALGFVLWVIYKLNAFPIAAVLIGLSALAVAVMIDGFYRIFKSRN
ncbi:MAG: ATP synthase I [Acidobacteria bacterium OLB17]|nr:MAG: ATP synthase I [Acidobacteria bacterium OLB17]MCZ2390219.1 ATP synthase subunit I [Acidobacteriota bacterium]